MLYFIISDNGLKIDLSHLDVTFNETNDWFTKEFSSAYSFPVKVPVKLFSGIVDFHYNSVVVKKQFTGKLFRNGELVDATLKLQEKKGDFVECIIFSGLEDFPNFDKKLAELPLFYLDLEGMPIKTHALEVITKNFPETPYNFFMLHTDQYDSDEFNGFQKIINNFHDGEFVENTLEEETNIDVIRNIMQPLPYLMYVLKKGFEDAGFELAGDILTIPDLQKAVIVSPGDYFESLKREEIPFRFRINEWDEEAYVKNTVQHVLFNKTIVVERKGDYILHGNVHTLRCITSAGVPVPISDIFIGVYKVSGGVPVVLDFIETDAPSGSGGPVLWHERLYTRNYDIPVSLEAGDIIQITKVEPRRDYIPPFLENYPEAVSLSLYPVRYRNPDGSPIISVLDLDFIDLKRCVPDMTFGDLVTQIRALKNLDFIPEGKKIRMDYITPKLSRNDALNLSKFDTEEPSVIYNDERSYELFFTDGKARPEYYESAFVDRSGVVYENYTLLKTTDPVEIDMLPLPVIDRGGVLTAYDLDAEKSKLRLAFGNAVSEPESDIPAELPVCFFNEKTTIRNIYQDHYRRWLNFLLHAQTFQFEFIGTLEDLRSLFIKKIIYAYSCHHVISELEKQHLLIADQQYQRVNLKMESLPLAADPL